MKFSYKFANLLGTVYHSGNLTFSLDGSRLLSPVGNRLSIFDLKNNRSETLPIESRCNIDCVALSPDGITLIVVDSEGEALLCSLVSKTVLRRYHFYSRVHAISFSPDGRKFAVTKDSLVQVFHAPGPHTNEFNPFALYRNFYGAYDATTCIDWTTDSRVFAAGSRDTSTRVQAATRLSNLVTYGLGGHSDVIINCFFELNSLDIYTISQNGQLCVWESDTDLDGLISLNSAAENELVSVGSDEDGEKETNPAQANVNGQDGELEQAKEMETQEQIKYKRLAKHSYKDLRGQGYVLLTSASYHKQTHILVAGFSNGSFFLHEMPDFNLIHSLSISNHEISSIMFNCTGDWIAFGCKGLGQLLVWEWQSETYILKQQGHFNNMNSLAYSPDGQNIVTGGQDGKVKVWSTASGFCFVTFTEHTASISCVAFNHTGQVVVSASLDGTVRAFDLNRYRNFRTFTSPQPTQLSTLAVDHSGEIICAGSQDSFELYVWSMQTGRLLEVLLGHEGPVSSLTFSRTKSVLASTSWDKTVKVWDIFESKSSRETIPLTTDGMTAVFRPDGEQLAVATLDCQITFWDIANATQVGAIEGRRDIGGSRRETDKITAKKSREGRAFTTLCYTADGDCIIAAGQSKNVCIYHVKEQLLLKRFEITCNLSFEGTEEFLDRRRMTEFGNINLIEEMEEGANKAISLPGVKKGDMAARHFKPDVRVSCVQFSPTGRAWAATTTEGLLIYSLDNSLVFDPFDLDIEVTPESVKRTLKTKDFTKSLMLAFRLNEQPLIVQVVEKIPPVDIDFISQSLPDVYVDKMLSFCAKQIESSRHIQFYLSWVQKLLYKHGSRLKTRSTSIMSVLTSLQKSITQKYADVSKICEANKCIVHFLLAQSDIESKKQKIEHTNCGDSAESETFIISQEFDSSCEEDL